jgi:hypothetical protein
MRCERRAFDIGLRLDLGAAALELPSRWQTLRLGDEGSSDFWTRHRVRDVPHLRYTRYVDPTLSEVGQVARCAPFALDRSNTGTNQMVEVVGLNDH